MGESDPYTIENKDGRFKVGDVLSQSYIKKIRFKQNKEKAHQYNRRTTFKVLSEDYKKPEVEIEKKEEIKGPKLKIQSKKTRTADEDTSERK